MEDMPLQELLLALFVFFISPILWLIAIALLVYVVISWLLVAGIVDSRNPVPLQIYNFLGSAFEPMLRPIRRVIPPFNGIDLSVLFLILIIQFLNGYAIERLIRLVPF